MGSEPPRISHVGLLARSPEGHAAKGMAIKGHEDLWVEIQANTFRNWVNENLRPVNMEVRDLGTELADGTRLCALVEVLQKRPLKPNWNKRPANQHQYLENVATALKAIEADGVKLVNIGNVDIVNGNLKLILGLIWSLIVRYQIGRSKFPPRKLMLAWLKAVLPECRVANFTTDWNSGVCLSALLDYCRPGLFPHWKHLDPNDSVENCRTAMELARAEFAVPMVLEPEYLASPFLDELSGMTYLSYFMKENSPGFHATLRWVNSQIPEQRVNNFTRDWNDGTALCTLVRSLGGPVAGYEHMTLEQTSWESNLVKGIHGGEKLGVQPILKAKDMSDKNVEHLGVMAYAAHFQWIKPRDKPGERMELRCDTHVGRVNKPVHFNLEVLARGEVDVKEVTAEVLGPHGKVECRVNLTGSGGKGSFIPTHVGMHQILIYNEGELIRGCPFNIRAMPEMSSITYTGMEPCAIGSIVEVLINSNGAHTSAIDVIATSPTGRRLPCPVMETDGVYAATFQPDEAGEWSIGVTHKGEHIQGGPFTCFVYDPNGVKLLGLEGAQPGQPFSFTLDAGGTGGLGDVHVDIVSHSRSVAHRMESLGNSQYRVSFTPKEAGKYRVYVYFIGSDVRGSPFTIRVGSQRSRDKARHSSSSHQDSRNKSSFLNDSSSYLDAKNNSSSFQDSRNYNSSLQDSRNKSSFLNESSSYLDAKNNSSSFQDSRNYNSSHQEGRNKSSFLDNTSSALDSRNNVSSFQEARNVTSSYHDSKSFLESMKDRSSLLTQNDEREMSRSPLLHTTSTSSPIIKPLSSLVSPGGVRAQTERFYQEESTFDEHTSHFANTERMHAVHNGGMTSHTPSPRPGPAYSPAFSPIARQSPTLNGGGGGGGVRYAEVKRRGSVDNVLDVDTSSNVRVSAMLGAVNARSDSWDAIAKTKAMLSYGSLESLANLAAKPEQRSQAQGYSHHVTESSHQHQQQQQHRRVVEASDSGARFRVNSPQHVHHVTTAMSHAPGAVAAAVSGDALRLAAVHKVSTINVELENPADLGEVTAQVIAPSRRAVPVKLYRHNNTVSLNFTATEIGEHSVDVRVANQSVAGSPFRTHAYNARAIQVGRIPDAVLGQPVEFEIDGSGAGSGNLEILVNGGHVTSFVRNLGNQRFLASFVPHEALSHLVDMKFNGETVPGSPWQVGVMAGPKMSVLGEAVRLVPAGTTATFELSALGFSRDDVDVQIISPSKRPVTARLVEKGGEFRVEFTPTEVGSHLVEVSIGGQKLPGGPLVAKVYNSALIKVTDVGSGVVGQPCQFRVDASQAGEGQLEISINEGEVPNHVQVVGGGRCLVSFTPEQTKPHHIDIKFNGETVSGCPFICTVSDTSRVSLTLRNLELVPVNEVARFHMGVDGSGSAELAVSVRGPSSELPVKVAGNVHAGFTAEFTPHEVGGHSITVEYNGHAVSGTPFVAKAYDAKRVFVGPLPRGSVGKTLQFMVDASQAGEGNLEITISARGHNIPTQVHPQGNARFAVSFVPIDPTDHVVTINFNKESVPGSPFMARVQGDSSQILVGGPSLSSAGVGKTSYFTLSNVAGNVEDVEVNVEGSPYRLRHH